MFPCQICQNVPFVFKYFFFLGPFPDFFFFKEINGSLFTQGYLETF